MREVPPPTGESRIKHYVPLIRRLFRIALAGFTFFVMLDLWGVDLAIGRIFTSHVLSIAVTLLLGFIAWEFVKARIDARLFTGTLTLSANATGTPPLRYQWQFEGVDIPGATSSLLLLTNLDLGDLGNYTVVVTSVAGSVRPRLASSRLRYSSASSDSKPMALSGR